MLAYKHVYSFYTQPWHLHLLQINLLIQTWLYVMVKNYSHTVDSVI